MKVSVNMTTSDAKEFDVSSWWSKSPEFVVAALQSQLEAAQAVWPELKEYAVTKKRVRTASAQERRDRPEGEG